MNIIAIIIDSIIITIFIVDTFIIIIIIINISIFASLSTTIICIVISIIGK